ncbi:DUF3987 domain-containing protein [Desulfatirhabdium butyrativorans]|uniref:DUF3987 domain-containing protein n=1 Tax=Desulfatirhabdium butyrativorans TaxID=340467 RepID=UPI0012EB3EA7|nr:DUF3987 domain-containing protein [Desulfatirhabdium butyrativorans]
MTIDAICSEAIRAAEQERCACAAGCVVADDTTEYDDLTPWPALSRDALYPGLIRTFVDCATAHSEADPAAVLASFLVRLSVEVGRSPYLMIGDDRQHVNLLAAIVGPSGNGRKGTSLKPVMRVTQLTDEQYQGARWTPGPLSSGEGIIWAVRDEIQTFEKGKKGEPGSWVVTDPGIEDKRLFIATEELASAFAAMAREGNTLSAIVRQIFDTGTLDPLTKTSKCKATGAHIGILGHITTFELSELLKECQIQNGLVNRFLWFCSRRQKTEPFPKPMSDADLEDFRAIIRDVAGFAGRTGEMVLSPEGKDLWREVYPALSEPQDGFLSVVLERGPVLVLRMAMLHALCNSTSTISTEHIRAALAVWEYCRASAAYIFDARRLPDPFAERLLQILTEGPKSLTEIDRALCHNSKGVKDSLKRLIEKGKIDCEQISIPGRKGRPKTTYRIKNPTE